MKTKNIISIVLGSFTAGWLATAAVGQTNTAPAAQEPPSAAPAAADQTDAAAAADDQTNGAPAVAAATNQVAAVQANAEAGPPDQYTPGAGLYLNFTDAPLNLVLNYLSEKAGLTIISDAPMSGRVTLLAKHPLTTNEVVDLLNRELGKNNYSATLEDKTLTIEDLSTARADTQIVPEGADGFRGIPKTDKIVTEILPVHTLNPRQLLQDLQPLIPGRDQGAVTANEAGNAVIMTAPQRDVRRLAEVIAALDSTAILDVEVFILDYGDAKAVASELKEIFQSPDSDVSRANTRNQFGGIGGGRGGRGGGGGFNIMAAMTGAAAGTGADESKNAQNKAVFTSDDNVNAVVASAPPDYMPMISNVIKALDQPSQEVTEVKPFKLLHADSIEVANELSSLFPNQTSTDPNARVAGMRFAGGAGGRGGFGGGGGAQSQSDRMKRQSTVLAVADPRTQQVTVTASRDMMEQIAEVIAALDEGTAGITHVRSLSIDNADPYTVQLTMQQLFAPANRSASTSTTTTALTARQTANANQQSSATTSAATSSGVGTSGIR